MIKEFISYLSDIASKHKAVNYVAYKRQMNINDQHNTRYYQFIIEDEGLLEKQLVEGIITLRLDVDILGFVNNDVKPLDVQDNALHILLDVIEYINNENIAEIRDYSVVSFSEYSDDKTSGIRASLQFIIPTPINICEYKDNFIDKKEDELPIIDIEPSNECATNKFMNDEPTINLKPIKLR